MLKHIAVSDLDVGMFVHKFEGGWFDHPFWKAKFLIEDADKLAAIRSSRLQTVVIDTARGRDLAPRNSATAPQTAAALAAYHPAFFRSSSPLPFFPTRQLYLITQPRQ
jgi:hypothetical protein